MHTHMRTHRHTHKGTRPSPSANKRTHMPCTPQARNDALADSLDLARRRISKQEDARDAAELKLECTEVRGVLCARGACHVGRGCTV